MIIVDGQQSSLELKQFANLEQVLERVMEDGRMQDRIVTDVLVNGEAFSEIYPHQAEDVDISFVDKVEVVSVSVAEMGMSIARELYKVISLMQKAAKRTAELFRLADDGAALEMYSDLTEVCRDFLNMVGVLRAEFSLQNLSAFEQSVADLSALFSEMIEIQENEDWILLADLLEYEFLPLVEKTKTVVAQLRESMKAVVHG
ncbi:MAG: hypothetical protein JG774_833 [Desulfomicrobiaceae bacterium]|jgi:hypothetical protein|nr:hypothetical protein [Desulfomicrobiaceae bacterium]MBZ4648322.1 hypothetical protein [Desulfomicrobiaceae bacterium]MBZ4685088.1 hypothetical protein [Desulfomicrobiaceae bacterium]MDI3492366.1 hypothetical protein [Desulfomicrobiaceae bacterium]MDK2872301.1 hypothetical protein [Desulfomicrobiaceae bacterium]